MPQAYVKKARSEGEKTASAVISGVPQSFQGALVFTNGSNAATLTIYDNASAASGKVLLKVVVVGADLMGGAFPSFGIEKGANGLYAELSGTGASFILYV